MNIKSICAINSIIMCYVVSPLSLYANESFKFDGNNIESHIKQTLTPIISKAISNHSKPLNCTELSENDPCVKTENYRNLFGKDINTPLGVYCTVKQGCCEDFKRLRNKEQYCECYASQLRKESYHYDFTTNLSVQDIDRIKSKVDNVCREYDDAIIEPDMWYEIFFYRCTEDEKLGVEFCDGLAQTTRDLIYNEVSKKANAEETNTKFELYTSEYNEILASKEYKSLLEQECELYEPCSTAKKEAISIWNKLIGE